MKTTKKHKELSVKDLRSICDPTQFDFKTTEEIPPLDGVIGQERAVRAMEFGLRVKSLGYNIYAAGPPGTGKKSLMKSFVERIASRQAVPPDIFFVHNFSEPDHPRVIKVPTGVGCQFEKDMEDLVENLKEEIPKALQSEDYERRRNEILEKFQQKRNELIEAVQGQARKHNLAIKGEGPQILTIPVANGEEITPEDFEKLPPEEQDKIREQQRNVAELIQEAFREIRDMQQQTQEKLKEIDRRVALIATGHLLSTLRAKHSEYPELLEYLKEVQQDVLDNMSDFMPAEQGQSLPALVIGTRAVAQQRPLDRYRVNVIVDNSKLNGAPVITESHPTYRNLLGFMEREAAMGTLYTDFTMIRAGSVLKANGGYLIIDIVDLLMAPFSWESLKRVIQNGEVKIEDFGEQYGLIATAGLRPQPVEIDLKVILLGNIQFYNILYLVDEDFQKLFKVKADFDVVMKKGSGVVEQHAQYVRRLCDLEELRHFEREAVAELVEHSSRMVADQTRLTLRFSDVADLIRESDYWAAQNRHEYVQRDDVRQAIEEKIYRSNLLEERLQELIEESAILIDTTGERIGQVNGLSVYHLGDYAFAKPTRITAQVSVGDKGVVNVEREAKLSGSLHDKGVFILSGYLQGQYGQNHPLALNASLCFEQSYGGVDGDSASSAELYAILSALSLVPLRQDIAVTGSVNQFGAIQPIGGVNEKIEGFFNTCKIGGLTGKQGVVIPHQNVKNLMLRREIIDAVRDRKFHIYPVETIDQGIEILTGRVAGEMRPDGAYPADTIHALAQQRLEAMWKSVQRLFPGTKPGEIPPVVPPV